MGKSEKREARDRRAQVPKPRQSLPQSPLPDRVNKALSAIVAEVNSHLDKMDCSMFTVGDVVPANTPLSRWNTRY